MKFKGYWGVFLLILAIFNTISVFALNISVEFNGPGTKYVNITIAYPSIQKISFNVTGTNYTSSYPSNISIDFLENSVNDWSYNVYHSTNPFYASLIHRAFSTNPDPTETYLLVNETNLAYGISLGYLQSNVWYKSSNIFNSTLLINSIDNLNEQIISVTTNETTEHIAVPSTTTAGGTIGLYVAEGGSTFYCNSDHTFYLNSGCNLTIADAMANHSARNATDTLFNFTEYVNNPKIKDEINNELLTCGSPCTINISVSSDTAGIVTLSSIDIIGLERPSNISIQENSTDYIINITNELNLSKTSYLFGEMPNVFIVPVIAHDDSLNPDINQTARYNLIKNSLVESWDNLTNKSQPMNFTFFNEAFTLENYSKTENNYSKYIELAYDEFKYHFDNESKNIYVILDLNEYFENRSANSMRTSVNVDGVISTIYLNGFKNTNSKTNLYRYSEEIILNILLHELAHTFIYYPYKDKLFYDDHPSSFTTLTSFINNTYLPAESPTGSEGYFEIYSILNQIRPFITQQEISRANELSLLDRILMGTLSPYVPGNYSFYTGTISYASNKYTPSAMTNAKNYSLYELYSLSYDRTFWDYKNSTEYNMNLSTYFSVSKQNQNNKTLIVYATDAAYPENFKVFNLNSDSLTNFYGNSISFISIGANQNYSNNNINFYCSASSISAINNITLFTNNTGSFSSNFSNIAGSIINYTTNFNDGNFLWGCYACVDNGCYFSNNKSFFVDSTAPVIAIQSPVNNTNYSTNQVSLNYSVSDIALDRCLYDFKGNLSTISSCQNITLTITPGLNNVTLYAYDRLNNLASQKIYFTRIFSLLNFTMNWSEWWRNETTNFSLYSPNQLYNIKNIQFSNIHGKISFLENLSLSLSRNLLHKIRIIKNKLWINSTLIPEFNKSSNITFRNVTLTHPIVKRDGVDCDTVCTNKIHDLTKQEYSFSVSSFSIYEITEQCTDGIQNYGEAGVDCGGVCTACPSPPPSGGGTTTSSGNSGVSGVSSSSGGSSLSVENNKIEMIWLELEKGTISWNMTGFDIVRLSFDNKKTVGKASILVQLLEEKPEGVSKAEDNYKYVSITSENINASEVRIVYRVNNSWIKDSYNWRDITLSRYSTNNMWPEKERYILTDGFSDTWVNLPGRFLYNDENYSYYESNLNGLGYFSIRSKMTKKKIQVTSAAVENVIEETKVNKEKKNESQIKQKGKSESVKIVQSSSKGIFKILLITLGILSVVAGLVVLGSSLIKRIPFGNKTKNYFEKYEEKLHVDYDHLPVVEYVKEKKNEGLSDFEIKKRLQSVGWGNNVIKEIFKKIKK